MEKSNGSCDVTGMRRHHVSTDLGNCAEGPAREWSHNSSVLCFYTQPFNSGRPNEYSLITKNKKSSLWRASKQRNGITRKGVIIQRGLPKKIQNLFSKNCLFIVTCLNVSHLPSTLHLMQYTYQDIFPLLKIVFKLVGFDAFYSFYHFLFHPFHVSKMFPSEDFFHLWIFKSHSGWDWVTKECGAQESWHFWSKTAEHSV